MNPDPHALKQLTAGTAASSAPEDSKRRGRHWRLLPVVLLGLLLLIQAILVSVAVNDAGFAVEQDYYAKATRWDDKMRQDTANLQLGWQVAAEVHRPSTGARIEVRLKDSDGVAVSAAVVQLTAFPNAHANRVQTLVAKEASAGLYSADLTAALSGLWEFRLEATRGQERFTHTLRLDVPLAQGGGRQ